jgi:hypothetical protein
MPTDSSVNRCRRFPNPSVSGVHLGQLRRGNRPGNGNGSSSTCVATSRSVFAPVGWNAPSDDEPLVVIDVAGIRPAGRLTGTAVHPSRWAHRTNPYSSSRSRARVTPPQGSAYPPGSLRLADSRYRGRYCRCMEDAGRAGAIVRELILVFELYQESDRSGWLRCRCPLTNAASRCTRGVRVIDSWHKEVRGKTRKRAVRAVGMKPLAREAAVHYSGGSPTITPVLLIFFFFRW